MNVESNQDITLVLFLLRFETGRVVYLVSNLFGFGFTTLYKKPLYSILQYVNVLLFHENLLFLHVTQKHISHMRIPWDV